MFQSLWEDAKREFSYGNMVTRLIIVNVAVFVLMGLTSVVLLLSVGTDGPSKFDELHRYFSISDDFMFNLTHPWVIFTHMFLHHGFLHLLFNMLFLYWFGKIVSDFLGNQRILPLYLIGGLAGALAYFTSAQIGVLPIGGYALGASAAVMAIVVAAGVTAPNYFMNLLFIGAVKLKYIVAVIVLLDLFSVARIAPNTGGSIAHLGGAAFGWIFVVLLRQGTDLSTPVNGMIDGVSNFFKSLFSGNKSIPTRKKRKPHVAYKNPNRTQQAKQEKRSRSKTRKERGNKNNGKNGDLSHQERVDAILDKIKKSGYESLTTEEKEYLFNASKQD
ncbi:MAG: rhomboid family intramembrane serine protease [Bacteroidota bacterium]